MVGVQTRRAREEQVGLFGAESHGKYLFYGGYICAKIRKCVKTQTVPGRQSHAFTKSSVVSSGRWLAWVVPETEAQET